MLSKDVRWIKNGHNLSPFLEGKKLRNDYSIVEHKVTYGYNINGSYFIQGVLEEYVLVWLKQSIWRMVKTKDIL